MIVDSLRLTVGRLFAHSFVFLTTVLIEILNKKILQGESTVNYHLSSSLIRFLVQTVAKQPYALVSTKPRGQSPSR